MASHFYCFEQWFDYYFYSDSGNLCVLYFQDGHCQIIQVMYEDFVPLDEETLASSTLVIRPFALTKDKRQIALKEIRVSATEKDEFQQDETINEGTKIHEIKINLCKRSLKSKLYCMGTFVLTLFMLVPKYSLKNPRYRLASNGWPLQSGSLQVKNHSK